MTTENLFFAPARQPFAVGQVFRSAGHIAEISALDDGTGSLKLTEISTGLVRALPPDELAIAIKQGKVIEITSDYSATANLYRANPGLAADSALLDEIPVSLRSEAAIKVVSKKLHWINLLRREGYRCLRPSEELSIILKEVEHRHQMKCPYTLDTIYRAQLQLDKHGGNARAILPGFHRKGGSGGHRLDPEVEKMIALSLDLANKKTSGKLQASRIHDSVRGMVAQFNGSAQGRELEYPSLPTVTRRLKERFTAYEIAERNFGKKRAQRLFRETSPRVRPDSPLDLTHYDDTDTCVFLVDDFTRLPWGRAWLTAGVDDNSRMVLGKSLSEEPRSRVSAIAAIVNGINPKNMNDDEYSYCTSHWDAFGHHGVITLDNASYNTNESIEVFANEIGSEIQYARPYRPTDKSPIEYFNHRLKSEFVVHQPGWSGPKEDREMLDEGIGTAVMTVTEFVRRLNKWIVDDYANKPMTDGRTPRQIWQEHFQYRIPMLPRNMPSGDYLAAIHDSLKFRDSGGLLRNGLRYQSPELQAMRKRYGANESVQIRYNPLNLSYLLAQDPVTKHFIRVPCVEDERYIYGMTDAQHRLVKKFCRDRKIKNPSLVQLQQARIDLATLTEQMMFSNKMSERKRSVLATKSGIKTVFDTNVKSVKQQTVVLSELENLTNQFMQIEDSDEDDDQ